MPKDRIEDEAHRLARADLNEIRKEYAKIEKEADEIDEAVERVERSIEQGARRSKHRFRTGYPNLDNQAGDD